MEKSIKKLSEAEKNELLREIATLKAKIESFDQQHIAKKLSEMEYEEQRGELSKKLDEIFTHYPELDTQTTQ